MYATTDEQREIANARTHPCDVQCEGTTGVRLDPVVAEEIRIKDDQTRLDIIRLVLLEGATTDPLLGLLMLDEITLNLIDGVKAEKLKTAGKSTVNRYLGPTRAILRRARDDWEWTDRTPKVKMFKEPPGRERSIIVEQAETLLGELPGHQRDVVLFAVATGLRQSNIVGLQWSHVDLETGHA